MDADYADPETVEHALKEWAEVFKKLPRIDAVFVPGGDPGHTRPEGTHGPAGEADRQPPPVPSQGPDVGLAAELLARRGWTSSSTILQAEPAWLSGVVYRPASAGEPARAAKGRAGAVPDPRLPGHHPQPALPVRRSPTGTSPIR